MGRQRHLVATRLTRLYPGQIPRVIAAELRTVTAVMSSYLQEARSTLSLAMPIVIGQVSQMLMGITDSVMIGRVGTVPLAASAFANSVFGVVFMLGIGLLIPVAVLVSRAHGGGDDAEGGQWLRHGMVLAMVTGVAGAAVMGVLGWQIHWFGQAPEVVAVVGPYYALIAVSLVPTLLFQCLRQFAEALGRPWVPMLLMLAGVGLNVVLNWIFIYGKLGVPALGLTGAGWATLIARVAGVVAIYVWLARADEFRLAWPYGTGKAVRGWLEGLTRARFVTMAKIGVPAAAMLMFEAGAFSMSAIMMGWLGAVPLAAHQIALSCAAFTFMFPLGLSMAVSMRIGKAVGEKRTQALRPIGYGALVMSGIVMLTFAGVFAVAGKPLAGFFVHDPAVIALAAQLLIVAALFQLVDGSQVIAAGSLRGLSDVKVPAVITFVAYWIVALPGAYIVGVAGPLGPLGVWISLAAGLSIAAVLLSLRFRRLTAG